MKHFCIIANRDKDPDGCYTRELAAFLEAQGCTVHVCAPFTPGEEPLREMIPADTQCGIVLGGDGTFLHGAKALQRKGLPVLGINLGNLGFLTAADYKGAKEALLRVVNDNYTIEERCLLEVEHEEIVLSESAMNDVVITRSGFSRLIHIQILVNGKEVDAYKCDGVIVSTPTGSTGYSLSAGGVVVEPNAHVFIITPICPHTLHARPLIVSYDSEITIRILQSSRSIKGEAFVTVDGDEVLQMDVSDEITVRRATNQAAIVMLGDVTFWERVRGKL